MKIGSMKITGRYLRLFALAFGVAMTSACANIKDVEFDEQNLSAPMLGVSKSLTERLSLEVELARTEGAGEQILDDINDFVVLDDVNIQGPAQLESRFELQSRKLGMGVKVLDKPTVQLKFDFGLSNVDVDLRFNDGLTRYDFNDDTDGIFGRFWVHVPFTEWLSASAYVGGTKFFDEDVGHMAEEGVRLALHPTENLQLFAGWFTWFYQNEDQSSDIQIEAEGTAYGLQLSF